MSDIGYSGRGLKILIDDVVIAACRTKGVRLIRSQIDSTHEHDDGWRHSLGEEDQRSYEVSVSGVATIDNYDLLFSLWINDAFADLKVQHANGSVVDSDDGGLLMSLAYGGESAGYVSFDATFVFSGTTTTTPAGTIIRAASEAQGGAPGSSGIVAPGPVVAVTISSLPDDEGAFFGYGFDNGMAFADESADGITWSEIAAHDGNSPIASGYKGAGHSDIGAFIWNAAGGGRYTKLTGGEWPDDLATTGDAIVAASLVDAMWVSDWGLFVISCSGSDGNALIVTTPDGVDMTVVQTCVGSESVAQLAYSPTLGRLIAKTVAGGRYYYSDDGATWDVATISGATADSGRVIWHETAELFIVSCGADGAQIKTSDDGDTWSSDIDTGVNIGNPSGGGLQYNRATGRALALGNEVLGSGDFASYSDDGVNWTPTPGPGVSQRTHFLAGAGLFVYAQASWSDSQYSADGITWNAATRTDLTDLGNQFFAPGMTV